MYFIFLVADTVYKYNNHMYHISSEGADWTTAQTDCRSRGMELVSIESAAEQSEHRAQIIAAAGRYQG